jgi:hypothetical protein
VVTYSGNTYTYTERKNVEVSIPASFVLSLGNYVNLPNGKRGVVITANPMPTGTDPVSCRYRWTATGGTITPGGNITGPISGSTLMINPFILNLMNETVAAQNSLVSDTIEGNAIQVQQVASGESNLSSSKSVLLEINTSSEEETSTEYITVETDGTSIISIENQSVSGIMPIEPVIGYNYAVLVYTPGNYITVTCVITSPCKPYTNPSIVIPALLYATSYTPANRSILLSKDLTIPPNGSIINYRAMLYNDFGYIKTVNFTSNEETVLIPLNSLPNGNYYINVVDEQNNVVERKLIIAN